MDDQIACNGRGKGLAALLVRNLPDRAGMGCVTGFIPRDQQRGNQPCAEWRARSSTQLILADYFIRLGNFLLATTSALIVGKAVLVADNMAFIRRFDSAPLIKPILFKTIVYCAFVFIARLLEANVEYAIHHGGLHGIATYLLDHFAWHRFAFVQLWLFVLFLVYVTASEFNALIGYNEVWRILFTQGSSERKLTRRQRIRALTRLDRLTAGHSVAEIADPGSNVHRECVKLIADAVEELPAVEVSLSLVRPSA